MPPCRPTFTRAFAIALVVASLGVPTQSAISAEPLIQQLCDILQHPDAKITREELKRRLEDEFEDDFITHINSLADGDLIYLANELGELPGSTWTDLIPEETTPAQQEFFQSVQKLIENRTIPDHISEASRAGVSQDRTNALRRAIDLSIEVLLGKRKPENAKDYLANIIKSLPSERIQDARGHVEKIDREALFQEINTRGETFELIDAETKVVKPTLVPKTVQYSGASENIDRIEIVDTLGRTIHKAPLTEIQNSVTKIDEKHVILPILTGAKIRVVLKDGSTFHQTYFDFDPAFPIRPLPTKTAVKNNKLSGGHITEDLEKFVATYPDLLEVVKKYPPQDFRISGFGLQRFTLHQYELSFRGAAPRARPIIKTTFDTPEAAAAIEKAALEKIGRKHVAKNKSLPTITVNLNISLPPEPRPDGSKRPWNSETERRAILPYKLYIRNPSALNRSSTSYAMPIVHKRPYRKTKKAQ